MDDTSVIDPGYADSEASVPLAPPSAILGQPPPPMDPSAMEQGGLHFLETGPLSLPLMPQHMLMGPDGHPPPFMLPPTSDHPGSEFLQHLQPHFMP